MPNMSYEVHKLQEAMKNYSDPSIKALAEFALLLANQLKVVEKKAEDACEEARRATRS